MTNSTKIGRDDEIKYLATNAYSNLSIFCDLTDVADPCLLPPPLFGEPAPSSRGLPFTDPAGLSFTDATDPRLDCGLGDPAPSFTDALDPGREPSFVVSVSFLTEAAELRREPDSFGEVLPSFTEAAELRLDPSFPATFSADELDPGREPLGVTLPSLGDVLPSFTDAADSRRDPESFGVAGLSF
jgi:hypothetical protein